MADRPSSVVIVGGGLAGAKAAEALREQGYDGPVTLLPAEPHPPSERPPMSKDYLLGKGGFDDATVHPRDWYAEHDVDLRTDTRAAAVRADRHEVELADGSTVPYGALILATGSEPAVPPIPGADGAHYLRTKDDSDGLRAVFGKGTRVVLVGGGWIGLEAAAAATQAGCAVTVLVSGELPLLRPLGREMAAVFADLHRDNGVDLRTGVSVTAIDEGGVTLADGSRVPADVVIVGTGATPNLELASSAGLELDTGEGGTGGVSVDAGLRTSDPDIYAVGDIASHDHPRYGRLRVEHWATARKQPAAAVRTLLGGDGSYDELPYFYSDQFDLGMEYVGRAGAGSYARVIVRGDLAGREFVAFWLDGADRVLAGMNVNVWDVVEDVKALVRSEQPVDVDRLADPAVPLSDLR